MNLVHDTVEHRERNGVQRNDFLNLLLQIKNKGCLEEQEQEGSASADRTGMTMNELAAQVFIFFVAGFETSSTVMNFCLYELAKNPHIQERLRDELNRSIDANGGEVTYDMVMGHEYLGQVVNGRSDIMGMLSTKHSLNSVLFPFSSAPRNPAQVSAARNDAARCGTGLHHTRHPARHTAPCRSADPGVRHTSRPGPLSRAGVFRSGPLLGGSVPNPDTVHVSAIRRGAPSVHRYAVRHDAGEGGSGEHGACVPLPPNGTNTGPHRVRSEIVHTLTCGG